MIQTPTLHSGHYGRLPLAELALHGLLLRGWLKRHYRVIALSLGLSLMFVVALQLVYPRGRLLPFARLNGQSVAFADQQAIERLLQEQQTKQIQVTAGSKKYQASLQDMGLQFRFDKGMTNYPVSARFIPFSAVHYARRDLSSYVAHDLDEQQAREYVKSIIAQNTRAAVEGSIRVEGVNIILAEPQAGTIYDEGQVLTALRHVSPGQEVSFTLPSKSTEPIYSKQALTAAAEQAKVLIGHDVTVTAAQKEVIISRQIIASALRFVPHETDRTIAVQLDEAVLNEALKPLASQLYIAPVAARVTTLDGAEISRIAGASGRRLSDQTTTQLSQAIQSGRGNLAAQVTPIAPAAQLNRTYSKTSQGLQVLINDWLAENRATRWSVVVKDLSGGRTASIKPNDRYVVASVYKLFLAYPVLTAVENGSLNLATVTSTGKTVDVCIEQMIVISSNPCSHAFGNMLGWEAITSAVHAKGFGSTSLSAKNGFYSTAADAALAAEQIHYGSYLPAAQNSRLLSMMRRQIYRGGIPAGSRGITVADKVGYVDGYRHDVAIVYHPRGTYILSVFSLHGSDRSIANLASRLNSYFHQ